MRKQKWILLILLPVMTAAILLLVFDQPFGYHRILNANWKWGLPAGYTERYGVSEAGFHGDGLRYHALAYRKGRADTINRMFFAAEPRTEMTDAAGKAGSWLKELDVPETEWPPFEACVCISAKQADGSEGFLFWHPDTRTLYVIESFI